MREEIHTSVPDSPHNVSILLSTMAVSFVSFFLVFKLSGILSLRFSQTYRKMTVNDKAYWDSCVTSSVNAIWSFLFGSYAFWTEKHLFETFILGESRLASQAISSLSGYLVFDTVLCFRYFMNTKGTMFTLAHHFAGIISAVFSVGNQYGLHVVLIFVMTEFSTPLVNMIYFLKTTGYRHSSLYHINSWVLYFAFGVARIFLPIPYLMKELYYERTGQILSLVPPFLAALLLLMPLFYFSLNGFWFFLMTRHVLQTYILPNKKDQQQKKSKKKNRKED